MLNVTSQDYGKWGLPPSHSDLLKLLTACLKKKKKAKIIGNFSRPLVHFHSCLASLVFVPFQPSLLLQTDTLF